jgi:hypothetical protein
MKRLVRTRMLGVVGGARSNPAPIPIALFCRVFIVANCVASARTTRYTGRQCQVVAQMPRQLELPKTVNRHQTALGSRIDYTESLHIFLRSCSGAATFGRLSCQRGASCGGYDRIGRVLSAIAFGLRPCRSVRSVLKHLRNVE